MAWILPVMSLVGTGMQAAGAIQSGQAEKQQQEYNAQVSETQAALTRSSAALTETQKRKEMKTLQGAQIMAYAKSGVTMSGSPLAVELDSAMQGELDIAVGNFNSDIQAKAYQSDADMRRLYGKQAVNASYMKAGTTLLSGATSFGTQYMATGQYTANVNGKTVNVAAPDYYKTRIGQ
jgi:hypothetical protein